MPGGGDNNIHPKGERALDNPQAELARRTGRPVQAINEIIKGEKALTPETALQFEKALGVPAHIWTGLESRYRLIRARTEEKELIKKELPYLRDTPYKQLAEMGYVRQTKDGEQKIRELQGFWLDAKKAVLLLSIRGRWADIFWFSLFHEIGHLMLHGRKTFVDDGEVPAERVELEREADRFAEEALIPSEKLREFIGSGSFGASAVRAFADDLGISAGIVVGRLQHEGAIGHDSDLNRLRERYEWTERA